MNSNDLQATIDSIKNKLGDETSALIADDIGILITKNTEIEKQIKEKDEKITQQADKIDKLVLANSSLLQQIPMGVETPDKTKSDDKEKEFSFKSVFDEKGNFIK